MSSSLPTSSDETARDGPNRDRTEEAAVSGNYKAMLDEAAERARKKDTEPQAEDSSGTPTIFETASQYVQNLGKMLGQKEAEKPAAPTSTDPVAGPPHRPDHDPQIADFVRDQHRSNPADLVADE